LLISSFRLHPLADLTRLWEALHGGKVSQDNPADNTDLEIGLYGLSIRGLSLGWKVMIEGNKKTNPETPPNG
jgi:hypothetical protein